MPATSAHPHPNLPRLICPSGSWLQDWPATVWNVLEVGLITSNVSTASLGARGEFVPRVAWEKRENRWVAQKDKHQPLSIGITSGWAPLLRNMAVSTIPGCTVATKILGFSAAKNSKNLTCANFEPAYAESPGNIVAGKPLTPVVTPRTAAWCEFAVDRKAFTVVIAPFTFVWGEKLN